LHLKKESSGSVSRVLFPALTAGRLSFIYSASHPTAPAFYPPPYYSGGQPSDDGLHELAAPRWNSPLIAQRLVVSYTTFSPLPFDGRLFSSSDTSCRQLLPFSEVGRPVLPGLSSRIPSLRIFEGGWTPATSRATAF